MKPKERLQVVEKKVSKNSTLRDEFLLRRDGGQNARRRFTQEQREIAGRRLHALELYELGENARGEADIRFLFRDLLSLLTDFPSRRLFRRLRQLRRVHVLPLRTNTGLSAPQLLLL